MSVDSVEQTTEDLVSENSAVETVKIRMVPSAQAQKETRWVVLLAVLTVFCCGLFIAMRWQHHEENEAEAWQIDAFTIFNSPEMGVFTSLQTAAQEIIDAHTLSEAQSWPEVKQLEDDYITPFVRDVAWEKHGRITWTLKDLRAEERHIAVYYGAPAGREVRGLFLLVLLHDHTKKQGNAAVGPTHAPYEIWYNANITRQIPDVITDQVLIAAGWKEVVSRSGDDEKKR
ncbi:MAG: hypothetical protein CSA20_01825 [Deltaproteobacteria bacterium]|nr:MAG: hypothetical protein CSA20_01825 [Deltaproteobacteria bacterium]